MMSTFEIHPLTPQDAEWVGRLVTERWGDRLIVAHGELYYPDRLPGFKAVAGGEPIGLVTYALAGDQCEIVTLDSLHGGLGTGSALIAAVQDVAQQHGCRRLWLITTNDNLNALHFYQKRGFRLVALRPNALNESRRIKPSIPWIGEDGIPLRDEIELEIPLNGSGKPASGELAAPETAAIPPDDRMGIRPPAVLSALQAETEALGFDMGSELRTGSLLRTLAASRPGGQLLELGTGTGIGTAWLLAGMDADARLMTVDNNAAAVAVAERHLGADARVTFHIDDAGALLPRLPQRHYDLIFADTWIGKFEALDETLALLKSGGLYLIDDLQPQDNWPPGHAEKVRRLLATLENHAHLQLTRLNWASGLMICVATD